MRKYRFMEELSILGDEAETLKGVDVHMIVETEDVGEQEVLELIEGVASGLLELLQDENDYVEDESSEIGRCFEELNRQIEESSKYDDKERWFR